MTKEVMVSIKGLQFDQSADSEEIETIQWGQYYKKNGTHYVIYDELMEGCEEPTKNIIKFRERELNLTKRGLVNVYMVFEENKKKYDKLSHTLWRDSDWVGYQQSILYRE